MSLTRRWASLCIVVLGIATLLVGSSTASAHTGFESSMPAQGDVVAEPVSSVALVFTSDTQPVDDLVVALDASGNLRAPTELTSEDQRTFTATFDPPLAGGEIGIRWTVLGADGHPLEGAFSFTVTAPLSATSTAPPATTEPAAAEPVATRATTIAATPDESPAGVVVTSPPAAVADQPDLVLDDGASAPTAEAASDAQAQAQSLDDFLAVGTEVPGGGRRLAGRLLSIPAVALAVGALAFLAWTMRGSAHEIAKIVSGVRIAGVVVAVGVLIQYLGSIAATGGSFATGWIDTPSRAMAILLVGAIVLVLGLRSTVLNNPASISPRPKTLSAAVIDAPVSVGAENSLRRGAGHRERWDAGSSKIAFVGVALLVASFWFDGHTVTKGWRPLHAVVNSVHVVAGSVWFGGVITLAAFGVGAVPPR